MVRENKKANAAGQLVYSGSEQELKEVMRDRFMDASPELFHITGAGRQHMAEDAPSETAIHIMQGLFGEFPGSNYTFDHDSNYSGEILTEKITARLVHQGRAAEFTFTAKRPRGGDVGKYNASMAAYNPDGTVENVGASSVTRGMRNFTNFLSGERAAKQQDYLKRKAPLETLVGAYR